MLIFNNLNISTITIGANIKQTNSNMFCVGNIGILNMFLNGSINNITNINAADAIIAHTSFLLLNTFVLNIDFLLSLTLNTCTSSDKASVTNALFALLLFWIVQVLTHLLVHLL